MIVVQATAKQAIDKVEMPEGYIGIRILVKNSGCNGKSYAMEWCTSTDEHDFLLQDASKDIYIDTKSMIYLAGSHLVYKQDRFQEGFEFLNPNESSKCGCGESFYVA